MSSTRPYYRKVLPSPTLSAGDLADDGQYVDLTNIPPPDYGATDALKTARAGFDDRAAALISAAVGAHERDKFLKLVGLRKRPPITWEKQDGKTFPQQPWFEDWDLTEFKWYGGKAPSVFLLRGKCLAALAYLDFFPEVNWTSLRPFVSDAIVSAGTGWCGSFGPGVDDVIDMLFGDSAEGNYDMNQMHLIPIAYRHYMDLTPAAREHLIRVALARGRVHRPGRNDGFTSGKAPDDWTRAGYVHLKLGPVDPHKGIDETENHILMINAARYLTNQVLFQRDHIVDQDNRRNGGDGSPSCLDLTLSLLRNMLRDDFSEYNAKDYQEETRQSLLNLCTYAYDHEVRLAARMVLDYISAHLAVSTNDLRRMVPFRRRNEDEKVAHDSNNVMSVKLLAGSGEVSKGADPMGPYLAMQAGNTRAYVATPTTPVPVGGIPDGVRGQTTLPGINGSQQDIAIEVLTDYRLPPSIHDLFVTDLHRRFFQILHRTPRDEAGGNRNCNNAEIYASSPSYLITAGGAGAPYAIDPSILEGTDIVISPSKYKQELGVAVTTSFMPTTRRGADPQLTARDLIQFSGFSDDPVPAHDAATGVANYGVAADLAFGHNIYLPAWTGVAQGAPGFSFVDAGSDGTGPGFYLAIYQQPENGFALLEAFDTWLHPGVSFEDFKTDVLKYRNVGLRLSNNLPTRYTTWNRNDVELVIWTNGERAGAKYGAGVLGMTYGGLDTQDAIGDAGNVADQFLSGTIMTSPAEAVVEIRNPFLKTMIRLDMSDKWHPKRTAEDGSVECAGSNEEVWLDCQWPGPWEGDVCHPFNTVAAASAAVANHGTIRIIPSVSHERGPIGVGKRFKLVAPIAGVTLGAGGI